MPSSVNMTNNTTTTGANGKSVIYYFQARKFRILIIKIQLNENYSLYDSCVFICLMASTWDHDMEITKMDIVVFFRCFFSFIVVT